MITLDGIQLFPVIAAHPALFAGSRDLINATAEKVVLAAVTDASLDLDRARALAAALGDDGFNLALDHLTAAKLKAVLKRIDANFKVPAGFSENAFRQRIFGIVKGTTEPAPKGKGSPPRGDRPAAQPISAESPLPEFSKSMGAKPRRRAD